MTVMTLNPATTALVLIDLQHGIVGMTLAPFTGQQVVERSARLAAAFRAKGAQVVYVRVDLNDMLRLPNDLAAHDPNAAPPPALASELVDGCGFQAGDLLITKRQWGAFHDTGLGQQLRRRGIDTIVLAGIATNIGVESTARAAFDQGYQVVIAEDACSTVSADAQTFAMTTIFPRLGRVRSAGAIVAALGG